MTFYLNTQLTVRHDNRLKCTAHGASWQAIQMHSSRCVMTGHLRAQLFTSAHCYSHQHQWRKGRPRGAGGVTPWGGAPAERQQYTPQCGAPSMRRPVNAAPPNVALPQCGAPPMWRPPKCGTPPSPTAASPQLAGLGWGGRGDGAPAEVSRGGAAILCYATDQHIAIHLSTWLSTSAHEYPH